MAVAGVPSWSTLVASLGVDRLGDVGWVHGANSEAVLRGALSDPQVHFIEGDISHIGGNILMAHPPVRDSDLDFANWLDLIVASRKGAKLDFKSPQALAPCLGYAARTAAARIPLCANADVLAGPGGAPPDFDAGDFLESCRELLPQAYLSLGWTVEPGGTGYTDEMIDEMLDLIARVNAPVTLCFHAGHLRQAWPRIQGLLQEPERALTIWGEVEDEGLLRWLAANTPARRCFYDLQFVDGSQVNMNAIASGSENR